MTKLLFVGKITKIGRGDQAIKIPKDVLKQAEAFKGKHIRVMIDDEFLTETGTGYNK